MRISSYANKSYALLHHSMSATNLQQRNPSRSDSFLYVYNKLTAKKSIQERLLSLCLQQTYNKEIHPGVTPFSMSITNLQQRNPSRSDSILYVYNKLAAKKSIQEWLLSLSTTNLQHRNPSRSDSFLYVYNKLTTKKSIQEWLLSLCLQQTYSKEIHPGVTPFSVYNKLTAKKSIQEWLLSLSTTNLQQRNSSRSDSFLYVYNKLTAKKFIQEWLISLSTTNLQHRNPSRSDSFLYVYNKLTAKKSIQEWLLSLSTTNLQHRNPSRSDSFLYVYNKLTAKKSIQGWLLSLSTTNLQQRNPSRSDSFLCLQQTYNKEIHPGVTPFSMSTTNLQHRNPSRSDSFFYVYNKLTTKKSIQEWLLSLCLQQTYSKEIHPGVTPFSMSITNLQQRNPSRSDSFLYVYNKRTAKKSIQEWLHSLCLQQTYSKEIHPGVTPFSISTTNLQHRNPSRSDSILYVYNKLTAKKSIQEWLHSLCLQQTYNKEIHPGVTPFSMSTTNLQQRNPFRSDSILYVYNKLTAKKSIQEWLYSLCLQQTYSKEIHPGVTPFSVYNKLTT